MKIKIIDLLNKIASGKEVPKEIVYKGIKYEYVDKWEQYVVSDNQLVVVEQPLLETISRANYSCLNDEIEIIEEKKKIEKIARCDSIKMTHYGELYKPTENEEILRIKINELIDEINSLKEK